MSRKLSRENSGGTLVSPPKCTAFMLKEPCPHTTQNGGSFHTCWCGPSWCVACTSPFFLPFFCSYVLSSILRIGNPEYHIMLVWKFAFFFGFRLMRIYVDCSHYACERSCAHSLAILYAKENNKLWIVIDELSEKSAHMSSLNTACVSQYLCKSLLAFRTPKSSRWSNYEDNICARWTWING